MTTTNDPTAVDWDSYDLGAAAKPKVNFPPAGLYLLQVPTLDDAVFAEGDQGQLKAKIGPLFIRGGEYDGFEIRYCTISNKRYSNRNASQAGDYLLAAKSPFKPQTKDQWKAAIKATSGALVEAHCEWDAYDKVTQASLADKMAKFPVDANGPGGHQRWIDVEDKTAKDGKRRVWANLRINYFRIPRVGGGGVTTEAQAPATPTPVSLL